jgi:hypothetical protein
VGRPIEIYNNPSSAGAHELAAAMGFTDEETAYEFADSKPN